MSDSLATAIQGTLVIWGVSALIAIAGALVLTAGSLSAIRVVRTICRSMINLTRGIPTSLLVVTAGLAMLRLPAGPDVPEIFPGTLVGFQHVAWGVTIALAAGSMGHLAEIFRAARSTLGRHRLDQAKALGLGRLSRGSLLARESAAIALAPTGTRLVHHLHNSAFAALFPIIDVFGFVEAQANATFRTLQFALVGSAVYVAMSGSIWLLFRGMEAVLTQRVTQLRRAEAAPT